MADDLKRVGLVFKADGTTDFTKSLKEVNASIQENRSAFKLAKSQWDENTKASQKLRDEQKYLSEQTKDYSDKVKLLEEELEQLESAEERDEAAIQKKKNQLNTTKAALNNYEKSLENVNKELKGGTANLKEFGEKLKETGGKISGAGEKISGAGQKLLGVTTAIVGVGTASATMATAFETSMAKVSTIMDETEMSLDDMQTAILDLSNQTGISADEIADNVYNAISAGQSTGDAVNFVATATRLATAGFAESADTIDILSTIMNAYGLEAKDVTKVSDMLVQTQNKGKTTVAELSSAMGKIIPTANASSVSLDQLCTGYALMTSNGVATAETTTYMNSMLNELGKTGSTTDKILRDKTGKSFKQLMEEGYSLADVLEIVNGAANEQNLTLSDMFGSAEAAKAGLILLGDGAGTFNEALAQMNESTGATQEGFDKMANTTGYKLQQSLQTLKNTAIELGDSILTAVEPAIETITTAIQELSEWFKNLDDDQKETIVTIGMVVAAIGPLLIVFGKVTSGIGSIITWVGSAVGAVSKAGPLIQGVMSTIGTGAKALWGIIAANPVIAIITAIIVAVVLLYNKCEWFRNGVNTIIKNVIGFFKNFGENIKNLKETVSTKFSEMRDAISEKIQSARDKVSAAADKIKSFLDFGKLKDSVLRKFDDIKNGIKEKIEWAKDKVGGAIDKMKSFFNFRWSLPSIPLPHFSISGSFGINPPRVPHFSVQWYKDGGILQSPTLFGMNAGKLLGGGEAGKEAVLPIDLLKDYIREENQNNNQTLVLAFAEAMKELNLTPEVNLYLGDKKLSDTFYDIVIKKINSKQMSSRRVAGA